MSDVVQNERNAVNSQPAPQSDKSGKLVLILIIAGILVVAAYQFFSCAGCYSSLPL